MDTTEVHALELYSGLYFLYTEAFWHTASPGGEESCTAPLFQLFTYQWKWGKREVRELRKNQATTLPGSLNFSLFEVKGHPAGPSTLFLTDIKVGTKYYSFLTVITGAWWEIGGRMWRTQGSWHGSTQSVQILSGPEVGYTDPKSSTVGTLSWDEKREVGKCQSWVILSKKRLVIANAISHLLF